MNACSDVVLIPIFLVKTGVDEADSVYQAKKWECKEAIKLNSAACFLKIGQYRECLGACNDILKVSHVSLVVLTIPHCFPSFHTSVKCAC